MPTNNRILYAEDDEVVREVIADLLRFAGYEVVVALDGEEALRRLEEEKFGILVVDNQMGRDKKTGVEVLREVRMDPNHRHLPVIIYATETGGVGAAVAEHDGIFLPKPSQKLLDLVSVWCGRKWGNSPALD